MKKDDILNKLMNITHQPFLVFANQVEEKRDNTFETLHLLAKEENVTAGRISEYLDIKPSSVTQIIKKLEAAGTVERIKSDDDARITFVKLTSKGYESIEDRGEISTSLKDEIFHDFSHEELVNLDEYLLRISDNISSDRFQEKLNEIFGDDKRWKHFSQMSSHIGRAREKMMEHSRFEDFKDDIRVKFDKNGSFFGRRGR